MTARAIGQRRGACPGLSAPMPTGDGLLVRLLPAGTIPLDAFVKLCGAAREHGNGIIEITARGSIQVRGLDPMSAPRFAAAIAGLGIAAADGISVLTNPLAGIDAAEILDATALAADLRRALARQSRAARLAPKVSVAIDGGGLLTLDGLSADVRLRAAVVDGHPLWCVGVGGDGRSATYLGLVMPDGGIEAATRLLDVIAARGREARARQILLTEGIAPFRLAIGDLIAPARIGESDGATPDFGVRGNQREAAAIGTHPLRDGSSACGVGLAFGHADATSLERLAEAAKDTGADGIRAAPGRLLITVGSRRETSLSFSAVAEQLGFIVRADDPRRHIFACAGAPICASAYIEARALAPMIAGMTAPYVDGSLNIHVSGCAKGCAHPAPAALTVVGTPEGCRLIADGSPHDAPLAVVSTQELPDAILSYVQAAKREAGHV